MSAPSSVGATNGQELPYGGDVQAAAKAQDREAIRTIMAWRTAKERGEAPPAAPAPAPPAPAPAAAPAPAPPAPAPEPAEHPRSAGGPGAQHPRKQHQGRRLGRVRAGAAGDD